jgi:hypothetical protein
MIKITTIIIIIIHLYLHICMYIYLENDNIWMGIYVQIHMIRCLLKKDYNEGVTKSNPIQKCRPPKGIRESTYK